METKKESEGYEQALLEYFFLNQLCTTLRGQLHHAKEGLKRDKYNVRLMKLKEDVSRDLKHLTPVEMGLQESITKVIADRFKFKLAMLGQKEGDPDPLPKEERLDAKTIKMN